MTNTRSYLPASAAASSGVRTVTAPSMGSARRVSTRLVRPRRGRPPGKSSMVLRPTITAAPAVRAAKCFRSSGSTTGCVPRAPMPQSE